MAINPFSAEQQSLIAMPKPGQPKQPLLSNKLFLQYMAGLGQDMSQGNPASTNVNAVTSQAITAQNWKNYMLEMLGPNKVPGGKLTLDDGGATFKYTPEYLAEKGVDIGDLSGGTEGQPTPPGVGPSFNVPQSTPATASSATTPTPAAAPATGGGAVPRPNPFVLGLSNLSDSDLAGLTPAMMTTGMEMKLRSDAAPLEAEYKRALIDQARRPPKDTTPTSIKEYTFAQKQGFDGTYEEWENKDPTSWQEYQLARIDDVRPFKGSYTEFLDTYKGSDTNVTVNAGDRARDVGKVQGPNYFSNPSKVGNDLAKYLSSEAVDDNIYWREGEDKANAVWAATHQWYQDQIHAGEGIILKDQSGWEGSEYVWVVKWANGDVTEVRRDSRQ